MTKHVSLLYILIATVVGICTAHFFAPPYSLVICGIMTLGFGLRALGEMSTRGNNVLYILVILFFLLGYFRLESTHVESEFHFQEAKYVELEGHITDEVDERTNIQLITFTPDRFSQKALLQYRGTNKLDYGDKIWVKGVVETPQDFNGFDYKHYLQVKGIRAIIKTSEVIPLKKGEGNSVLQEIYKLKHWFVNAVQKNIPDPENQVVLGMVIGARRNISKPIQTAFQESGTSHVLSVSGFNITLIVVLLGEVLAKALGRKNSFSLLVLLTLLFVVLTGASSSVIRAGIMGIMLLLSKVIQRPYGIITSIILSATIMVFINPLILFYDPGFQLSFIATIGLSTLMPLLENHVEFGKDLIALRSYTLSSLAAIIATLPLTFYFFGTGNMLSLIANILILPAVPGIMALGSLAVLPMIGAGFGFVASLLVDYITTVLQFITSLPWARISYSPSLWFVIIWYLILAAATLYLNQRTRLRNQTGDGVAPVGGPPSSAQALRALDGGDR